MATKQTKKTEVADMTVEEKLKLLYEVQLIDSAIDEIKTLRGELPLVIEDLEDELEGLDTRIANLKEELDELNEQVAHMKVKIKTSQDLISKYSEQQKNVRNNREYDSLSKEIEYQTLEIELSEKRIKEFTQQIKDKKEVVDEAVARRDDRNLDLKNKKSELDTIVKETQKQEEDLNAQSNDYRSRIEPRLLNAYNRIRSNALNGLAVVPVDRDACGGCFNKIPPQRQLDIQMRKKVIVCEYCGRILVDSAFAEKDEE